MEEMNQQARAILKKMPSAQRAQLDTATNSKAARGAAFTPLRRSRGPLPMALLAGIQVTQRPEGRAPGAV